MTARADLAVLVQQARGLYAELARGYPSVKREYRKAVFDVLLEYGTSDRGTRIDSYQSEFRAACLSAFPDAFWLGYASTAGEADETDSDATTWLDNRTQEELGHINSTMTALRDLRTEVFKGTKRVADIKRFVEARRDGYTNSLDGVYNAGAMWGRKNMMLTWHLGATEVHCSTCAGLDGKSHRAKWYVAKNYIPRTPGSDTDCGGYNCDCFLTDPKGDEVTL